MNNTQNLETIFPKGNKINNDYFTGIAWLEMLVTNAKEFDVVIGNVTFEPTVRNNWHSHPGGQILLCTSGSGYYQEKGKAIQLLHKGDVVQIASDIIHWHGATPNSAFTHIAISTEISKGDTVWLAPVTDEEYYSLVDEKNNPQAKVSENAIHQHEKYWPNYISESKQTDPELIEVFDNFAFDEILQHGHLEVKERTLFILASTIGSQSLTEYNMFVHAALNIGITPVEIKEVLYQSVPYVGISKVIDFIYSTNDIFVDRNIQLPLEGQSTTNTENRWERGLAIQKEIFGDKIGEMYHSSPKDLLHIQHYLSANCFGDYITRNGLDIQTRELITLAFLTAMGGTEAQLKGHIQGNYKVGNDRQKIIDLLTQLVPYVGYPRTLNAINCLNEVLPHQS